MVKINLEFQIYPYGKVWDMLNKKEDEEKKDWVSIYTSLTPFDIVPLSSLEGYFVVFHDKSIKKTLIEKFSRLTPQYHLKRKNMASLEEEYNGKFFEK
jgi:hypothetical protein